MTETNILKSKAIELRKSGKSYSEIYKEIGVSKSTLSSWFSGQKWSRAIGEQLKQKWAKVHTNRLIEINKSRKLETIGRHNRYKKEAKQEFEKLIHDPLFLIGLSLYWGEGSKQNNGRVGLINTDVDMLKIVVSFFKISLKIPSSKLRGEMFIYEDHNKEKSLDFWSKQLKIPKNQFIKTQELESRSKMTKRRVKYGMCNVYFSSTEMNIKIMKWIELLANNTHALI